MTRRSVGRVQAHDRGLLVLAVGLTTLWIALSELVFRYLRPFMRPWLALAGAVLTAMGAALLYLNRRVGAHSSDHDGPGVHHGVSRAAWLLVVPVLVAVVVNPGSLGSYAVTNESGFRTFSPRAVDLAPYLRAGSASGQAPKLEIGQFVAGAASDGRAQRQLLAATPVRLTGFITHVENGGLLLSRLVIGCCAGDAIPVSVRLTDYTETPPADDTWVEVTGTYEPVASSADTDPPNIAVHQVRTVDQPSQPYEYPF